MPNDSLDDALKEVYALAPNDRVPLDTLELKPTPTGESIFMVQDRESWQFTLEDGVTVQTFEPVPFRFTPPTAGANGVQEMRLAIDNVDRRIIDFVNAATGTIEVIYRPYMGNDPTTVLMTPPLVLYLTDIQVTAFEVTARATFTDVVNKKYLTRYYDRSNFPGLAG